MTKAKNNPFTYRGYYFDADLDFYYLGTRYYDAKIGRFVNSDGVLGANEDFSGYNLFSYCGNDPINRIDYGGQFWDYVLDVVFIGIGVADLIEDPSWSKAAWLALDVTLAVIPFIPALSGARHLSKADDVVDVAKAADKADDTVDIAKSIAKGENAVDVVKTIHGNSLNTTKEAVGYALVNIETNEIMKYGETTMGMKRYTKKFYAENNVRMDIIVYGSKREMHFWQHDRILEYTNKYNKRPPWNKSNW